MSAELYVNEIQNCEAEFLFKCPLLWDDLQNTDDPFVRYCDQCQASVRLCLTVEEQQTYARQRHCIAIPGRNCDDFREIEFGLLNHPSE